MGRGARGRGDSLIVSASGNGRSARFFGIRWETGRHAIREERAEGFARNSIEPGCVVSSSSGKYLHGHCVKQGDGG